VCDPGAINTQTSAITTSGEIGDRYTSPEVSARFLLESRQMQLHPFATSIDIHWINAREIVEACIDIAGTQRDILLDTKQVQPSSTLVATNRHLLSIVDRDQLISVALW
jgi:hypothetical protein